MEVSSGSKSTSSADFSPEKTGISKFCGSYEKEGATLDLLMVRNAPLATPEASLDCDNDVGHLNEQRNRVRWPSYDEALDISSETPAKPTTIFRRFKKTAFPSVEDLMSSSAFVEEPSLIPDIHLPTGQSRYLISNLVLRPGKSEPDIVALAADRVLSPYEKVGRRPTPHRKTRQRNRKDSPRANNNSPKLSDDLSATSDCDYVPTKVLDGLAQKGVYFLYVLSPYEKVGRRPTPHRKTRQRNRKDSPRANNSSPKLTDDLSARSDCDYASTKALDGLAQKGVCFLYVLSLYEKVGRRPTPHRKTRQRNRKDSPRANNNSPKLTDDLSARSDCDYASTKALDGLDPHKKSESTLSVNLSKFTESTGKSPKKLQGTVVSNFKVGIKKISLPSAEAFRKKSSTTSVTSASQLVPTGCTLRSLAASDLDLIPVFVRRSVEFMEFSGGLTVEGVYRVPGGQAQVAWFEQKFAENSNICFATLDIPLNVVATSLKNFFASLPEALVPYDRFRVQIQRLSPSTNEAEFAERRPPLNDIGAIAKKLPRENREVLRFFLGHLRKVAQNANVNCMDRRNLAKCWWPTFLRPHFDDFNSMSLLTPKLEEFTLLVLVHSESLLS